jgi:hypothetical protein
MTHQQRALSMKDAHMLRTRLGTALPLNVSRDSVVLSRTGCSRCRFSVWIDAARRSELLLQSGRKVGHLKSVVVRPGGC